MSLPKVYHTLKTIAGIWLPTGRYRCSMYACNSHRIHHKITCHISQVLRHEIIHSGWKETNRSSRRGSFQKENSSYDNINHNITNNSLSISYHLRSNQQYQRLYTAAYGQNEQIYIIISLWEVVPMNRFACSFLGLVSSSGKKQDYAWESLQWNEGMHIVKPPPPVPAHVPEDVPLNVGSHSRAYRYHQRVYW